MDISILKNELDTDSEGRGYSGMTDAEVLADLTEKRYVGSFDATALTIANRLGRDVAKRLVSSLEAASASESLVKEAHTMMQNGVGVDLGHDETRATIDELAANSNLDLESPDATAIKALAENLRSRADVLGIPGVELKHVRWARLN